MLDASAAAPDNPPVSWLYKTFVRPNFFNRDPEEAHNLVIGQLAWVARRRWALGLAGCFLRGPKLPGELFGLKFPNPVGLAAGMDKGGTAVPVWAALGLGFSELGGVTQRGQPGNPQPRMFRVVEDEALINRMGFNNPGADAIWAAARLARLRRLAKPPGRRQPRQIQSHAARRCARRLPVLV